MALQESLRDAPQPPTFIESDLTDLDAVGAAFARIDGSGGAVDILVNNCHRRADPRPGARPGCAQDLVPHRTLKKQVFGFDLLADGGLAGKRLFTTITGGRHPDGMAVDAAGFV